MGLLGMLVGLGLHLVAPPDVIRHGRHHAAQGEHQQPDQKLNWQGPAAKIVKIQVREIELIEGFKRIRHGHP